MNRISLSLLIVLATLGALTAAPALADTKTPVAKPTTPTVIVFSGVEGESAHKDHKGE
jgi:hypothetical protein